MKASRDYESFVVVGGESEVPACHALRLQNCLLDWFRVRLTCASTVRKLGYGQSVESHLVEVNTNLDCPVLSARSELGIAESSDGLITTQ